MNKKPNNLKRINVFFSNSKKVDRLSRKKTGIGTDKNVKVFKVKIGKEHKYVRLGPFEERSAKNHKLIIDSYVDAIKNKRISKRLYELDLRNPYFLVNKKVSVLREIPGFGLGEVLSCSRNIKNKDFVEKHFSQELINFVKENKISIESLKEVKKKLKRDMKILKIFNTKLDFDLVDKNILISGISNGRLVISLIDQTHSKYT